MILMETGVGQSFMILLDLSRICKCMFMPLILIQIYLSLGHILAEFIATLFLASLLCHELWVNLTLLVCFIIFNVCLYNLYVSVAAFYVLFIFYLDYHWCWTCFPSLFTSLYPGSCCMSDLNTNPGRFLSVLHNLGSALTRKNLVTAN